MAGIYIHIPFCKQKCTYCDFHFSTTYHAYQDEMISAMLMEMELRKEELSGQAVETIYFGGGTPSLLTQTQLISLIEAVKTSFNCIDEPECTLEANPDDIDEISVSAWKAAGINRLSVGVQSFDAQDLLWMNRAHSADQGLNCIRIAQHAGITNISLDLMYGLPDMDNERWLKQIRKAIELGVKHISAYCLTVEEKTVLHKMVSQKKVLPASNEQQGEQFELLVSALQQAGIEQYEISNFAEAGYISRHNSNYWRGIHYLGIGPSAHSFNGKSRSWNVANNREYMRLIQEGNGWYETEILTKENQFNELLLTGLRTIWGVELSALEMLRPFSSDFIQKLEAYKARGWVSQKDGKIVLTQDGKLWADAIAEGLFV